MKVVCFGDSNTWGYDPRDFFGGPYDMIWPELLQKKTGWNVCNWGENGREIPSQPVSFPGDMDLLILMLGTNDLLQGREPGEIRGRLERFLRSLSIRKDRILLVSPPRLKPGTWVADQKMMELSVEMSDAFRAFALQQGIIFADSEKWNLPIAYDGVHLTEQGHKLFAEGILKAIKEELELCCKQE